MKTFQSTPITFIDQTDSRKLEVYITSNLPTVQIFNGNSGAYTPDWREGEKLVLSMDVFLDSRTMTTTEYNSTAIKWYKNDIEMSDGSIEDISDDKRKITITDNILKDNPIITYTCEAEYQGIKASTRITFTRIDTGLDGQKGADGTSVRILGTAKSATLVTGTSYHTIVYDTGAIVAAELGDAYVLKDANSDYDGHLFVCALLNGGQDGTIDYFIDAGQIQGPAGDPAKIITLIGSAQVFKVGKDGNTITPKSITVTAHTVNIDDNSGIKWQYKYDTASTWTEITNNIVQDTNSKTIISINNSNDVATVNVEYLNSRTSIALKATYDNAEDALTMYKVFDGVDGDKGDPGDDAPIAFLSNEHISFVADANGNVGNQTVYTSVVGYKGATREKPALGSLNVANAGLALIGMNVEIDQEATDKLESEVVLKISVNSKIDDKDNNMGSALSNNGYFSIPAISPASVALQLNWTKVNAGPEGVGIRSVQVKYGTTQTSNNPPQNESDWKDDISQVVVPEGHYLWTRTLIDYTDDNKDNTVTYTYVKQGVNGAKGDSGTSVGVTEVRYAAHTSASIPPSKPINEWSSAVVATSATSPYLWTRTIFSDGKYADSVARYGTDGAKGDKGDQGIQGIQGPKGDQGIQGPPGANGKPSYFHIKYSANSNGNPMSETPSTYIGTYVDDQADDSDNYLKYTWSRFVGSQGSKGDQGIAGTNGVDGKTSYLHIAYATSADGKSGFSVSDSVSKTYIGQYTDYTEDDSTDPTKYKWTLIKGDKGDQGVQGPKGNDGQQLYTWIKYADTPTSGMSNDPTGKTYIGLAYNKTTATESSTYSDYMWSLIKGETGPTGPKGDNGQQYYTWIKYADNASGANMSDSPTGKLYIGLAYNKTTSTESNVAADYTWALFKGDKGDTGAAGADAYTVLLTNESHVFAGSTSAAVASSATTQVLSYKGTTSQSATIVSVNGVAASTASTATGIAGLSFQCNALSGTSPTITFTCTTAFVSPNGTIPIVIKVGSISITKMFTYSIAFKGATGGTGSVGPASSSYWLVSNASAVQKTSSGDILCTPATLTFTGRIQTGTSAPTNYAGRWILAYSTDGSTYTDFYTSTANEATASIAASATYKAVRARMYLAGGTTTLLDEQIIPFVSDGETGAPGATGDNAVTFQVYSNNGYALSAGVPTILLQTFAYFGDVEITSGATFQWYRHNGTDWVAVSGATNAYFNVSRDDVSFSNNYMCKMQFNGTEYVGVVTIEDKNDENKVFASKPSNYFAGDLWIVGTDYTPPGYTVGTMLRAEHTNNTYTDSDWVPATKYDDEIDDLRSTIDSYKEYFSVDSTNGLQIGNSSINNDVLTIDHVETSTMDAISANIESLNVVGKYSGSTMLQAPVINLGKFSLVIESNGSLSIVANT